MSNIYSLIKPRFKRKPSKEERKKTYDTSIYSSLNWEVLLITRDINGDLLRVAHMQSRTSYLAVAVPEDNLGKTQAKYVR